MHILAVIIVSGSAISDACRVYYCELWLDCVTMSAYHYPVQWLQLCLWSSECTIECKCACLCLPSMVMSPLLYDVFSSCFAAGALASAEPGQTRTIYQAVVDQNWGAAEDLLSAVREGKLSGSVWSVSSLGKEHSVVDSWSLARFMKVRPFSSDDVDTGQPFSWMNYTFWRCLSCQ